MPLTLAQFFEIDANVDFDPTAAAAKSALNVGAMSMSTSGGSTGKITGLTAATLSGEALGFSQSGASLAGLTLTANLVMSSNKITGLADGTDPADGVNKSQLDAASVGLSWRDPVSTKDYIGTRTIAQINALSPASGETVVAGDAGTPTAGTSDVLAPGDIAEFDGADWKLIVANSGGFPPDGTRLHVHDETFTLFSPLTDGVDESKIAEFDGTSRTPATLTAPSDGWAFLVAGDGSINENRGFVYDSGTAAWIQFSGSGGAHSSLTGLSADDHTQYALLAGRSGGQTLIGDTASGGDLTLQSTSNATRGQVLLEDDGAVGAPALSFASDSTTGIFENTGLAFAVSGGQILQINTGDVTVSGAIDVQSGTATGSFFLEGSAGVAANPTYAFTGDTGTGMYRVTSNSLGWSTGGVQGMQLTSIHQLRIKPQTSGTPAISGLTVGTTGINIVSGGTLELISSGSIALSINANQAATFTGQLFSTTFDLTAGATISVDCNEANSFDVTLGAAANAFQTPTNLKDGARYVFIIRQDGTGGRTATFSAAYIFPNGTTPNLSSGISEVDILDAVSDGTSLYCSMRTNNVKTKKVEQLTVSGLAVTLSETPVDGTAVEIALVGGVHQVHKSWDGTTYDYDVSGTTVDFDDTGGTSGAVVNGNKVLAIYEYEA